MRVAVERAAVEAQVCRWGRDSGVVSFGIETNILDGALADGRQRANTDPNVAEGVRMLEGLTFAGTYDLASGVVRVTMEAEEPATDPIRQDGLEMVRHGLYNMVSGALRAADVHRSGFFMEGAPDAMVGRVEAGNVVVSSESAGVMVKYSLQRGSLRPIGYLATANGAQVEVRVDRWVEGAGCGWVGRVSSVMNGESVGAVEFKYGPMEGGTFVTEVVVESPTAGPFVVRFADPTVVDAN